MLLFYAPNGLWCPRCGVRIDRILPGADKKLVLTEGSLLFCCDCAAPVQWRNHQVVLLTPGEIFEKIMVLGDSYREAWEQVQAAVKLMKKVKV